MMLMVCTFVFLPIVGSEGSSRTAQNYANNSSGEQLPKKNNSERLTTENDSSHPQIKHGIDDVPNYLPTGFHDFVSSDQGPTYSYDKTGTRSKSHSRFRSLIPYVRGLGSMLGIYHPSDDNYPKRSAKDASYRMVKPYRWYSADAKVKKYPIPEDRLPPVYRSAESGQEKKNSRKARFVKNLFGYKSPNTQSQWWPDGKGLSAEYRPEDLYMLMSTMKNGGIDRSDQVMDDGYSDNGLSTFLVDPIVPIVVIAILLPLSMMLAACLPLLLGSWMNGGSGGNIPLVTTTATGNMGKTLEANSSEFLPHVPDSTDSFSPRSDGGECTMKALCRKLKSDPTLYPWNRAILDVSTLVEDSWLKTFGLGELIQSIRDGKCERIQCFRLQTLTDSIPVPEGDNSALK